MRYNHLNLTKKQVVLIALLVCALELSLSFCELWERRIEFTSNALIIYTGLPLEAIKINYTVADNLGVEWWNQHVRGSRYPKWYQSYKAQQHYNYPPGTQDPGFTAISVTESREYLWNGILLNTMLFIVFSIIVAKLSARIHNEIEYHRHYKV